MRVKKIRVVFTIVFQEGAIGRLRELFPYESDHFQDMVVSDETVPVFWLLVLLLVVGKIKNQRCIIVPVVAVYEDCAVYVHHCPSRTHASARSIESSFCAPIIEKF